MLARLLSVYSGLSKNQVAFQGLIAVIFLTLVLLLNVYGNKKYSFYEDCILDKIKDAQTVVAANMVRNACSALYPKR